MRDLHTSELAFVSGAGGCYTPPPPPPCSCTCPPARTKNNNGYGNGAESGPPPGNSGANNPQLIGPNLGPRGVR
jgi:hypothetical protein